MIDREKQDSPRETGRSNIVAIPTYNEVRNDSEILHRFNNAVTEEFRANDGNVGGPFEGADIVLVTLTGAKSKRKRTTPLFYFEVDGRLFLIGTYGGAPRDPAWVHNLRADPRVHVEFGDRSYDAVALELEGAERRSVFDKIVLKSSSVRHRPDLGRAIPVFELVTDAHGGQAPNTTPQTNIANQQGSVHQQLSATETPRGSRSGRRGPGFECQYGSIDLPSRLLDPALTSGCALPQHRIM